MAIIKHYLGACLILFISLTFSISVYSQSKESGYVKEYNGKDNKPPLSGVEIRVSGAPTTISSEDGFFCLNFVTLKPGQQVKYNEIYKPGFVLFNEDALKVWRISDDNVPFNIVLCREPVFKNLQRKYYNLLDNFYLTDYQRQRDSISALVKAAIADKKEILRLNKLLETAKKNYQNKVDHMSLYVDIFSRIDISELSDNEAQAIALIEQGSVKEALEIYDSLRIKERVRTQLELFDEGRKMVADGEMLSSSAQSNLIKLITTIKRQIACYDAGGVQYAFQKEELMYLLIDVFHMLNNVTGGEYVEEEGEWICQIADSRMDTDAIEELYTYAANLPSFTGLKKLTLLYECKSVNDTSAIRKAKENFIKCKDFNHVHNVYTKGVVKKKSTSFYDFRYTHKGTTLSYKIINHKKKEAAVCQTNTMLSNYAKGTVIIPSKIVANGTKYRITQINKNAFSNCFRMDTLIIPSSIRVVQDSAFVNDFRQIIIHDKSLNIKSYGTGLEKHIQNNMEKSKIGLHDVSPILVNSLNDLLREFSGIVCVPDICRIYDCMVYGISTLSNSSRQQYANNEKYISAAAKWAGKDEILHTLKENQFIVLDYSERGLAKYGYKDLSLRLLVYQTIIWAKSRPDLEKISSFLKSKAMTLTGDTAICYNYLIEGKKDIVEYLRTEGIPLEEGAEIIGKMLDKLKLTEEEKHFLNIQMQ